MAAPAITSAPPLPLPMPPSWMTPLKLEPLVMVSVFDPRLTTPAPPRLNRPATEVPELVCEMSNLAPAPARPTKALLVIEPFPFSARVAPPSICVALL
jgi:hypothetical protein